MSNPKLYSRVDVYQEATLLVEHATVEVTRKTGSQPISSVQQDYAGESQGAMSMEIHITSGVPAAGFELDPGSLMKSLTFTTIRLYGAGKMLTTTGIFYEDALSGGVSQETKSMLSFRGNWAQWE